MNYTKSEVQSNMKTSKKKSIESLKSALNSAKTNTENGTMNGFKRLCAAYISTGDAKQRERAISKVLRQEKQLNEMLRQNDDILIADIEKAMTELATGCTVTETRIRTGAGGKTVETIVKQLPPNQAAAEFLLINKASDRFARNPEVKKADGEGRLSEVLEAIRNVR